MSAVQKVGAWSTVAEILYRGASNTVEGLGRVVLKEALLHEREIKMGLTDGAPNGMPFKPLSPFTLAVRLATGFKGTKPMLKRGDLRNSIKTVRLGLDAFTGVLRTAKSRDGRALINIAEIHENGHNKPIIINVDRPGKNGITPRQFIFALFAKGLIKKPLKRTTRILFIKEIPARPFIGPIYEKLKPGQRERMQKALLEEYLAMPPNLTAVVPSDGPMAGGYLVTLVGTDFDVSDADNLEPVQVMFGGVAATRVRVRPNPSAPDTILTCLVPKGPYFDAPTDLTKPVDVVVTNLVTGGVSTIVNGFVYRRESLISEQGLTYLVRTLLRELKNQVLANTGLSAHTDFDSDPTTEILEVAKVPGLMLLGPTLRENRFYSLNANTEVALGTSPETYRTMRGPYTVDVTFDIRGVTTSGVQHVNLMHLLTMFFHRNKFLSIPRVPEDVAQGVIQYEMDWVPDNEPRTEEAAGNSNLKTFRSQCIIRGVDLDVLENIVLEAGFEVLDTDIGISAL